MQQDSTEGKKRKPFVEQEKWNKQKPIKMGNVNVYNFLLSAYLNLFVTLAEKEQRPWSCHLSNRNTH